LADVATRALIGCGIATIAVSAAARALFVRVGFSLFNLAFAIELALYAVALLCVLRRQAIARRRSTLAWVLGCAVAFRLVLVPGAPFLSDDVYRYVWDGRVQAAGINPYRFVPDAPELAHLRDDAVYPHINRRSYAPTIYPPAAQLFFRGAYALGGGVIGMKLLLVVVDLGTVLLLAAILAWSGVPPAAVIVYAWHPLACWEIAASAHVDALAIALLVGALAVMQKRPRAFLAGVLLGLATLVKGYPALAVPAFLGRGRTPFCLGFASTFVLYAPYADVGSRVLGFLPTYVEEEGIASGERFPLLRALRLAIPQLPTSCYLGLLGVTLVVTAWLVIRAPSDNTSSMARQILILGTVAIILGAPHYAWYYVWLIPLATLDRSAESLWIGTSGALLYHTPHGATARLAFELGSNLPLAVLLGSRLLSTGRGLRSRARAMLLGHS
jgi:hypothetical protein